MSRNFRRYPAREGDNGREEELAAALSGGPLRRAIEQGWILLVSPVELTPAGKQRLSQQVKRARRGGHRRRMLYV